MENETVAACSTQGGDDKYEILVGEPDGKAPLERSGCKQEDKTDLKETGWEDVDWIELTEDRIHWWNPVNTVMNFQFP